MRGGGRRTVPSGETWEKLKVWTWALRRAERRIDQDFIHGCDEEAPEPWAKTIRGAESLGAGLLAFEVEWGSSAEIGITRRCLEGRWEDMGGMMAFEGDISSRKSSWPIGCYDSVERVDEHLRESMNLRGATFAPNEMEAELHTQCSAASHYYAAVLD